MFRCCIPGRLKHNKFHFIVEKIATETNVDGRFNAIACENPEFYPGIAEELDCFGNTVLQSVFDGCAAEELEVAFYFVGDFFEFRFSFVDCRGGYFVSSVPVCVVFFG